MNDALTAVPLIPAIESLLAGELCEIAVLIGGDTMKCFVNRVGLWHAQI